jgi:hypothetical protein
MTCITADEASQVLTQRLEALADFFDAQANVEHEMSRLRDRFQARANAYRHAAKVAREVIEEYTP